MTTRLSRRERRGWDVAALEAVIASGPDAILIAPTDVDALQTPLQTAVDAGIVVVLVDTTLSDPSLAVSQIASDCTSSGSTPARPRSSSCARDSCRP